MEITATAQQKLRSLLTTPDRSYRLTAEPGGCQGYNFSLKIIHHPRPHDVLQSFADLSIYIDSFSLPYFEAVVMDYTESNFQSGFTFKHPHSCSCGKSFAPDGCSSK